MGGARLCRQEERRVGNGNTVKWRGLTLQIPPRPLRPHFVRAMVCVHEYPDGRLAIFHGPLASPITTSTEICTMTPNWLRDPLPQPPVDLWTTRRVTHNPTGPTTIGAVN
jgi:hypothetical protein